MDNQRQPAINIDLIREELARLRPTGFINLAFSKPLEQKFEQDTATARSQRMWLEGLLAVVVLNGCLLVDYLMVRDVALGAIVRRTAFVTPLALLVNWMMRRNLRPWAREGSVAAGATLICFINLYLEGSSTAATATFGLMGVLILVLFTNVVMRVRLNYAAGATALMLLGGMWFASHASGLTEAERSIGASMMAIGVAMTLTAGYSLEREERMGYLLLQQSELQAEELQRLSNLDKLTGLPNRRAFEERFETLWKDGYVAGTPLSAIVVDIDHFKVVNDVYGHLYGDEVLRRIAGLLPKGLRVQEDIAARFGGEEFVILLPDAGEETAMVVAERVRVLVEMAGTPVPEQFGPEQTMWATVSCGVSTCVPTEGFGRERLLKCADRALYKAKANGRNRVEFRSCEASVPGRSSGIRFLEKLAMKQESGSRAGAEG